MIRSMTGFGRATVETGGKTVTVEIRTLNSKQLDLNTRIPLLFKNFENDFNQNIVKSINEITIKMENEAHYIKNIIALQRQIQAQKIR